MKSSIKPHWLLWKAIFALLPSPPHGSPYVEHLFPHCRVCELSHQSP
jgi:hypothetical protein